MGNFTFDLLCRFNVLLVYVLTICGSERWIEKCLKQNQGEVVLNCPKGHVIIYPQIMLGLSNGAAKCLFQDGDCTGLTSRLAVDLKGCYFKNWCKLKWQKKSLTKSVNATCKGKVPTYLRLKTPSCTLKERIVNFCDSETHLRTHTSGFIRSSQNYPRNYQDIARSCKKTLPHRTGYTLELTVLTLDLMGTDYLYIYAASGFTEKALLYNNRVKNKSFQISTMDLHLIFNVTSKQRPSSGVFISFHYKKDKQHDDGTFKERILKLKNDRQRKFMDSTKLDVSGTLDSCLTNQADFFTISCPIGHVIYSPDVTTGVSSGRHCRSRSQDCTGLTHTLVSEKNNCYWKKDCNITASAGIPITMTTAKTCFAQMPTYMSIKGYDCLPQDDVYDFCDETKNIQSYSGIIKSHYNYPWLYPTKRRTCKIMVPVFPNLGLRILANDVDLDSDSRGDYIKFYNDNHHLLTTLRGRQHVDIILKTGCLLIEFHVGKESKGGQGFVLKFDTVIDTRGRRWNKNDTSCNADLVKSIYDKMTDDVQHSKANGSTSCKPKRNLRRKTSWKRLRHVINNVQRTEGNPKLNGRIRIQKNRNRRVYHQYKNRHAHKQNRRVYKNRYANSVRRKAARRRIRRKPTRRRMHYMIRTRKRSQKLIRNRKINI